MFFIPRQWSCHTKKLVVSKFQKIIRHGSLKNYLFWSLGVDEVIETNHEKIICWHGFIFLSFNFYFPNFKKLNIKQQGLVVASHLPPSKKFKKFKILHSKIVQKNLEIALFHIWFFHLWTFTNSYNDKLLSYLSHHYVSNRQPNEELVRSQIDFDNYATLANTYYQFF